MSLLSIILSLKEFFAKNIKEIKPLIIGYGLFINYA